MEYIILNKMGTDNLQGEVNKYIKEGWKPLGGVSVAIVPQVSEGKSLVVFYCSQAMTR